MNLASLDLNLLVALDALLAEGHVGRAASRVGLSQPAMSHALRRLRDIFADPLLVRVGARMELTPRAQGMRGPLAQTLDQVRGLFQVEAFDPASSRRRFALMMPDIVVDLIVPALANAAGETAPGIRLDIVPWQAPAYFTPDLARSVDLIMSCIGDAYRGFHRQLLYTDSDALAVRADHPARRGLGHLPDFLEARHIAVVGRGSSEDMIDAWLGKEGIHRTIAVVAPSYLQALHLAARTDLVAFVPRRLIAAHAAALVARGRHAAARPRRRRAVPVLPDPRPARSWVDLAARADRPDRRRAGGARRENRLRLERPIFDRSRRCRSIRLSDLSENRFALFGPMP